MSEKQPVDWESGDWQGLKSLGGHLAVYQGQETAADLYLQSVAELDGLVAVLQQARPWMVMMERRDGKDTR